MLDAGCGEGHYAAEIVAARPALNVVGYDISRDACRYAAKRLPTATIFVHDTTQRLPLRDASADCLINLFAPRNAAEFARVLKPTGSLLIVVPTVRHLLSLRKAFNLMDVEADKAARLQAQLTQFELAQQVSIQFEMRLAQAALRDLIMMGPNGFHRSAETLDLPAQFETEAAVELLLFHPR